MHTRMPIGIDNFKKAKEGYYVVDKTALIRELLDTHMEVSLFTRPRRFGKTLTMSMLEYFFSIDRATESEHLFKDSAIEKAGPTYMKEKNKYPVIFLTLKECAESSWDELFAQFKIMIQSECKKHLYLLTSPSLLPDEQLQFKRYCYGTATEIEYKHSLSFLSLYLYRHFQVKPIILVDEYDAPLQYAYTGRFYDKAISFFRRWFSAALKGNESLNFAVLTGVLRIAKESIFSGLNNLAVYSTLADRCSTSFGFTNEEVKQMAQDLGYSDKLDEIKQWYDGYTFGHADMYNPWSVINYFAASCTPAPYWVHTSNNSILKDILYRADASKMEALQKLLDGNSIRTVIDDSVIYNDIEHHDSALYSLLLNTGYLKAVHKESTANGLDIYDVQIPNEEIKRVYKREILMNLLQDKNINVFTDFQLALLQGKGQQVLQTLEEILLKMASCYDTRSTESFYHGLLLGLTSLLEGPTYHILSNRESGYGRFDLAIIPTNTSNPGVIMEFKLASSVHELQHKAQEALQQIEDKAYITTFQTQHIRKVWKYGIAFHGKHVAILQTL